MWQPPWVDYPSGKWGQVEKEGRRSRGDFKRPGGDVMLDNGLGGQKTKGACNGGSQSKVGDRGRSVSESQSFVGNTDGIFQQGDVGKQERQDLNV